MAPETLICVFIIFMNIDCYYQMPQESQVIPANRVKDVPQQPNNDVVVINVDPKTINSNESKSPSVLISTTKSTIVPNIQNNTDSYIESGAVMRGVFVFVAITLLFIMYLVFKTYRKGNRKQVAVKKYGVRARRTDTEMEPLHLDDEEEDETLFVRNVNDR